jgi:hypothetical protein
MSKLDKLFPFCYDDFINSRKFFRLRFFAKIGALDPQQFFDLVAADMHLSHFAVLLLPSTTRWAVSQQACDAFRKPYTYRALIAHKVRNAWVHDLPRFQKVMVQRAKHIWVGLADIIYHQQNQQFQQQRLSIIYLRHNLPIYVFCGLYRQTSSTNYHYVENHGRRKLTRRLTYTDYRQTTTRPLEKLKKEVIIPWKYARLFEVLSRFVHENAIKLCIQYFIRVGDFAHV